MNNIQMALALQSKIPLYTERLIVRPYRLSDVFKFWEYTSDKSLYENLVCSKVASFEEAEAFVIHLVSSYKEKGITRFVIADKDTNKMVGVITVYIKKSESVYTAELGYWIGKEHKGKGYMTEVLKLIAPIVQSIEHIEYVYLEILDSNIASIKVAEASGFKSFEQFKFMGTNGQQTSVKKYILQGGNENASRTHGIGV